MSENKIGGLQQNTCAFNNYRIENKKTETAPTPAQQTHQTDTEEYTVKRADTLTKIAIKTGQNLQDLIKDNPQIKNPNKIYVGQKIHIGGGDTKVYTVKRGDTLYEIAKQHNVRVSDIVRANPREIRNRNLIFPGQRLNIPIHAQETPASKPKTAPSKPQPPVQIKPSGTTSPQVENKPNIE